MNNINIIETRKILLEIDIADALASADVQWDTDVYVQLVARGRNNRPMTPIKLSYAAVQRLTQDL
jgi:hypothetical protein